MWRDREHGIVFYFFIKEKGGGRLEYRRQGAARCNPMYLNMNAEIASHIGMS